MLDPSAASFRAELVSRGLLVADAINDVVDGIRKVSTVMKLRKLRVHKKCTNGIAEIGAYCWDAKAALRGEEKPIKAFDHFVDAIRYAIHTKIQQWRISC